MQVEISNNNYQYKQKNKTKEKMRNSYFTRRINNFMIKLPLIYQGTFMSLRKTSPEQLMG